jgi:prephenate dehydrogenase
MALLAQNARKESAQTFEVTAFDPRTGALSASEKRGVATRYARHFDEAVGGSDIVVLALPYAEVQSAYRVIAPALRKDAVILDTSPLKRPSIEWAKKYLPAEIHMVGLVPILNAQFLFGGEDTAESASADLLSRGAILIAPEAGANREAVELAADFAALLGASPHFVDPNEYDGIAAAAEGLPALLAAAFFASLKRGDGWDDVQRAGNPALAHLTYPLHNSHPDDMRDLLLLNRENSARAVTDMIEMLVSLRDGLLAGDRDVIEGVMVDASDSYSGWLQKRSSGKWDKRGDEVQGNQENALMSGLLGGFLARRLRRGDKKSS